ncbi:DEAD/DEAH box helicase [Agathobaculum sp.]|uniref:DEAD/DEAH box helicase n=1 Tax=Agathobaculum sp. TaxID=2048138 RepID=UPI002A83329B|nr:DEAD/DEAH box helicase family protein [Agathobaculum sp.]MDY3618470.1 DEAD/DEAH box helicase family protein [Agathobaculum sp.]
MELKDYQKNVLADLKRFLALLTQTQSTSKAYRTLWEEKNVIVGLQDMLPYKDTIPGVPHVCMKVPTGGGKTFIAAAAIKPIFDSMPASRAKAVVWLVPSDAILTQTQKALTMASHPYRQRIDVDFGSNVGVYSKAQLLSGQNFNPTSVTEQLSVFVLSYDSFRTSKKEGRKAYQENGALAEFARMRGDDSTLLEDTDETALIQVVRSLNPVIIVDESHHATSDLSVKMLEDFNPAFILDLTATPKKGSNIISFVDAAQLKQENMVKLPVIVYNRKNQADVYSDAVSIRAKLEAQAKREQETSGRYIRPIVLFQAQPKNSEDSTTYEKIKKTLVDGGIKEQEIAIKTGDKDELKNVDLLSPDCPIRYIITVNALKEGWDCPFAYILATVANRSSVVDVEQILGRVLRLPYTKPNKSDVLNLSYVITSSADFYGTLDKVVEGLNRAGFSSRDYRVKEMEPAEEPTILADDSAQLIFPPQSETEEDETPEVDTAVLREKFQAAIQEAENTPVDDAVQNDQLLAAAAEQGAAYSAEINTTEDTDYSAAPQEVRDKMSCFKMVEEFAEEASALRFPQFMLTSEPSIFSDQEYDLLELDNLAHGFTLKDKDVQIDFSTAPAELAKVDVDDTKDAKPRAWKITGFDSTYFKEWFNAQPSASRRSYCKGIICKKLSAFNCINDKELNEYVTRVMHTMTEDELSELEQSPYPFVLKIEEKVKELLAHHAASVFDKWLEQDVITCQPSYKLPPNISPISMIDTIPKSLYSAEDGKLNDYERKVIWELASLPNIKWWHRNISRRGFMINGNVHAFPDLIVLTTAGRILMVETKGDHLDNDQSKAKAGIGSKWDAITPRQFRYFMVFQTKQPDYPGAYSYERFMEIIKEL